MYDSLVVEDRDLCTTPWWSSRRDSPLPSALVAPDTHLAPKAYEQKITTNCSSVPSVKERSTVDSGNGYANLLVNFPIPSRRRPESPRLSTKPTRLSCLPLPQQLEPAPTTGQKNKPGWRLILHRKRRSIVEWEDNFSSNSHAISSTRSSARPLPGLWLKRPQSRPVSPCRGCLHPSAPASASRAAPGSNEPC